MYRHMHISKQCFGQTIGLLWPNSCCLLLLRDLKHVKDWPEIIGAGNIDFHFGIFGYCVVW